MKKGIFLKLLSFLLIIGIIPVVIFALLMVNSYQELINKYVPYVQHSHPEVVSDTQLNYRNIKIQTVLILWLVMTFVVFFSVIFSRKILRPVKKLMKGTDELRKGNLSARIDIKTKDEFESLANSFNKMAKSMEQSKASLEKRRGELQKAYEKIKKSKEDLEKWYKLTVGRELRMIELKKEIRNLEERVKEEQAKQ